MGIGDVIVRGLACGAIAATVAACASEPETPAGMAQGGPAMQSAPHLANSVSWRSPDLQPGRYTQFVVAPVKVYEGADAHYGDATQADKQAMAAFMQSEFSRILGEAYPVRARTGPNTARLELTLAGLSDNVPVASTAASVLPLGLARNLIAQGQSSVVAGTVTYKGDVYDTQTNKLVASFVTTKTPAALDLGATFDSRTAQQAAITDGARDTRDAIQSAQQAAARPAG